MSGLKFKTLRGLEGKISAYFESCGEGRPPTLAGLALALGFDTLEALEAYRREGEHGAAISRARLRLRQYAEEQLFSKTGSAGARFLLAGEKKPEARPAREAGADTMAEVRRRLAGDE